MTTAIICGGRELTFTPTEPWGHVVARALSSFDITKVIHGDSRGADRHASIVARAMDLEVVAVPAKWDEFGPKAGPMRNAEMLRMTPNMVLALPGGKGTMDMCNQAEGAGVTVVRLYWPSLLGGRHDTD